MSKQKITTELVIPYHKMLKKEKEGRVLLFIFALLQYIMIIHNCTLYSSMQYNINYAYIHDKNKYSVLTRYLF